MLRGVVDVLCVVVVRVARMGVDLVTEVVRMVADVAEVRVLADVVGVLVKMGANVGGVMVVANVVEVGVLVGVVVRMARVLAKAVVELAVRRGAAEVVVDVSILSRFFRRFLPNNLKRKFTLMSKVCRSKVFQIQ
jgi:hypothetical protein